MRSWSAHQLDITNVFLHAHLNEGVYIILSEGYMLIKMFITYVISKSCSLLLLLFLILRKSIHTSWVYKCVTALP